MVITEKPLTYIGISGIVFPTILVMMFPEGSTIYSIANILLTLFSGFLFILTIFSACGQKKVIKLEESYDIPLFESFVSSFGDEYAIVWKKTNELVEIPENDGKLAYADAHRILNDYLKQYPDKIWGVQIVPRVEIVTHIYPSEEAEPKSFVDEVEEISIDEAYEDQAITDEVEEISPIKEIAVSIVEDTEETQPTEDMKTKVNDGADENIVPVDETEGILTEVLSVEEGTETMMETEVIEEIPTLEDTDYPTTGKEIEEFDDSMVEVTEEVIPVGDADEIISINETKDFSEIDETEEIRVWDDDPETLSVEEDTEIKVETEVMEEISSLENTDDLGIADKTEDHTPIEEIVDSQVEQHEEISVIEYKEDLVSTSDRQEISISEDLEEAPIEKDNETKAKGELLSNIPDPYIILSSTEEISSAKEAEDLSTIEEISTIKEIEAEPSEKVTETKVKGKLLSNIPDPYIILDKTEELDKANDEYKLKVDLEEE
ncbi:MAG: hypothetical protein ACXAC2_15705 [Candidatus Kariarchaeaceae archaeon]|jgi:hypothetical protein